MARPVLRETPDGGEGKNLSVMRITERILCVADFLFIARFRRRTRKACRGRSVSR